MHMHTGSNIVHHTTFWLAKWSHQQLRMNQCLEITVFQNVICGVALSVNVESVEFV